MNSLAALTRPLQLLGDALDPGPGFLPVARAGVPALKEGSLLATALAHPVLANPPVSKESEAVYAEAVYGKADYDVLESVR
ncbi:MAG: hypothetical protein ACRDRO_11670 [Pseudonocardiaceae bacterium]